MIWPKALRVAALGLGFVAGCADDSGLARRFSVSGTITYHGQRVEKGTVNFVPTSPGGRAAGGTIVAGRYSLTTHSADDGALPGSYKVCVIAKEESDPSKVAIKIKKPGGGEFNEAEKKMLSLQHQQLAAGKATNAAKSLIPTKYSSAETTDLAYEVKEQSNTADFELKD